MNEATARIRINSLLEKSGWRFFPEGDLPSNIRLEQQVALKKTDLDALGNDFEKTQSGFVDFLLLDSRGFPLVVLEAKSEDRNPLIGKEQARTYARSQNCRFIILSNGNLHYFWDLERGNPHIISTFPSPDSVAGYTIRSLPTRSDSSTSASTRNYIALTQRPGYASEAAWKNESERPGFIQDQRPSDSCGTTRFGRSAAFSGLCKTAETGSCSRWLPAPARRWSPPPSSSCSCEPPTRAGCCSS